MSSTSNINRNVSVILADPQHVHPNVESFADTRTLTKSLAVMTKVDTPNVVNAINRVQACAAKTNYLQNCRANLTSTATPSQ